MSPGGVGRNIAHNLALLGQKTLFISVFGADAFAVPLMASCRRAGIDISHSPALDGESTAVYLFIADARGEMELAVSDMGVYDSVTPAFLEARMDVINAAAICAADTNIPRESLEYLARNCKPPLFVDPVSTAKAQKLRGLLSYIAMLKANALETQMLTGIEITGDGSLAAAARALLDQGLGQAVVTLGAKGVYCACARESYRLPVFPGPVRNATGAGDSFMAAFIWARLREFSLEQSALAGLAAASLCIASEETVCPELGAETIVEMLKERMP
jgi:pseudouridine kinase